MVGTPQILREKGVLNPISFGVTIHSLLAAVSSALPLCKQQFQEIKQIWAWVNTAGLWIYQFGSLMVHCPVLTSVSQQVWSNSGKVRSVNLTALDKHGRVYTDGKNSSGGGLGCMLLCMQAAMLSVSSLWANISCLPPQSLLMLLVPSNVLSPVPVINYPKCPMLYACLFLASSDLTRRWVSERLPWLSSRLDIQNFPKSLW